MRFGLSTSASEDSEDSIDLARHLAATGLTSEVSFRTTMPGATIRYRLLCKSEAETAALKTNDALETLPIGLYFVWAERNGQPSSKHRYRIVEERKPLDIPEDR